MKKKTILSLIRYHAEKNETGFRNEAYDIAKEFDQMGDYQLAEYIMSLLSDANTFVPQVESMQSKFFEKIDIKDEMLLLPDAITQDIIGIVNAVEHRNGRKRQGGKIVTTIPEHAHIESSHIIKLRNQLCDILEYWEHNKEINGALVSVYYRRVIAKSNRIGVLLSFSGITTEESIRGSKFKWEKVKGGVIQKHIFIHYIPLEALVRTINTLDIISDILEKDYSGEIHGDKIKNINKIKDFKHKDKISISKFKQALRDCWYVEDFGIERPSDEVHEESIVTIYETNVTTKDLLAKFGIVIYDDRILDKTTIRLRPDEFKLLLNRASYLVSMSVTDLNQITRDYIYDNNDRADNVAKMLGVELGEEFIIENADRKETVVLAMDGLHVIQPNNVLGPDHGKLLSKVLQGLYDVVKKPWVPKEGEYFYYPDVKRKAVCRLPWDSQFFDFAMKALDMVYRTQEEAEAHFAEDYERLTGRKLEG